MKQAHWELIERCKLPPKFDTLFTGASENRPIQESYKIVTVWEAKIRFRQDGDEPPPDSYAYDLDAMRERAERAEASLRAWHELVTVAHVNRDALWPNSWPQDVAWIAHCLHAGQIPPNPPQATRRRKDHD